VNEEPVIEAKGVKVNMPRIEEDVRAAWGFQWLETLVQDVRYGARMLRHSLGFTAVAILTLALGIGANTAIFSLIDAVMLRSIPVNDPQSLLVFNWLANKDPQYHSYSNYGDCGRRPEGEHTGCSFSVPFFKVMRAQGNTFTGIAAFAGPMQFDLSGNGPASMARAGYPAITNGKRNAVGCRRRTGSFVGDWGCARNHRPGDERLRLAIRICGCTGLAGAGVHHWREVHYGNFVWPCARISRDARRFDACVKGKRFFTPGRRDAHGTLVPFGRRTGGGASGAFDSGAGGRRTAGAHAAESA
jgi:hypothetical protein